MSFFRLGLMPRGKGAAGDDSIILAMLLKKLTNEKTRVRPVSDSQRYVNHGDAPALETHDGAGD